MDRTTPEVVANASFVVLFPIVWAIGWIVMFAPIASHSYQRAGARKDELFDV